MPIPKKFLMDFNKKVCSQLSAFLDVPNAIGLRIDEFTKISLDIIPSAPTQRYFQSEQHKTEMTLSFLAVDSEMKKALEMLETIKSFFQQNVKQNLSKISDENNWKVQSVRQVTEPSFFDIYEDGKSYIYSMNITVYITY